MLARSPQDLGLVIREQRRALGLEQRELASRVGVSRQWIVEIEKGKARAALDLVLRTLTELGLLIEIRVLERPGLSGPAPPEMAPVIDLDEIIERARTPAPALRAGEKTARSNRASTRRDRPRKRAER